MSYKCHSCNKNVVIRYNKEMNRFACSFCGEIISGKQLLLGVIVADCILLSRVFECEQYTVFKAFQKNLQRNVLIKILNLDFISDNGSTKFFFEDLQKIAAINYPNFIQVYESGISNDVYYAIFDYFDGENLSDLMSRVGAFDIYLALNITIKLCNALENVSERILDRYFINPDNIWVNSSNEIKIYNLGRCENEEHFSRYNAPEINRQNKIKFDIRQYIYTVGAISYEMVSGLEVISIQEFNTDKILLQKQQSCEPISLKHLFKNFDEELSDFIDKLLKIKIDERPSSWKEVKAFFERKAALLTPMIQSYEGTTNCRTYESLSIPVKYNFRKIIFLVLLILAMTFISFFSYEFLVSHKRSSKLWNEWNILRNSLTLKNTDKDINKLREFISENNKKFNDNQRQYVKIFMEELIYKKSKNKLSYIKCKNLTGLAIILTQIIDKDDLDQCSVSELYSYLGALDDLTNHFDIFLSRKNESNCNFSKLKALSEQLKNRRMLAIKIFNEKKAHLKLMSSDY